ncbi:MAG TPA: alanine racemase [Bacillota bacterium]|nr:alanine racemase [Bacillota bacterium]
MFKRVSANINLENLIGNYKYLRSVTNENSEVAAVVKADAYGHGADRVANALQAAGVGTFCVASLEEAIALRNAGIYRDVLILGRVFRQDVHTACEYGFILTVTGYDMAKALADASYSTLRVHIKLDTGMTRNGIYCHSEEDVKPVCDECEMIHAIPKICPEGIYTHFCVADSDREFTKKQFDTFMSVCDGLARRGINCGKRHCCSSAGILFYPEYHLDMVRAGIALYGYSPSAAIVPELHYCMTLESRIDYIREVKQGDAVGYGRTYVASRDMKVAVISIGYGDGFSRLLSNKACLTINSHSVPVVGNICMDACMADITGVDCHEGDRVVIFGTTGMGADKMADTIGTISYEILCDVGKRVDRIYL